MELDRSDVVRHPLVSKIIERYEGTIKCLRLISMIIQT